MSELFNLPEVLSPRLAWIKKHEIRLYRTKDFNEGEEPWAAWKGDINMAIEDDLVGTGETEDEALTDLAKLLGVPLWNEERFVL